MADAVQSENSHARKPLTQDRLRELLCYDPETGIFTWRVCRGKEKPGSRAGTAHPNGYTQIGVDRARYLTHRLAWLHVYGRWPANEIDHINCDRSDNRIVNLRDATRSQNKQNAYPKSSLKGTVRTRSGKWLATICKDYKHYNLGVFATREEAHAAYRAKAQELFGDFARFE